MTTSIISEAEKYSVRINFLYGCCDKLPQLGGLKYQKTTSQNSGDQRPKVRVTALKLRHWPGGTSSRGSGGEYVTGFFQVWWLTLLAKMVWT